MNSGSIVFHLPHSSLLIPDSNRGDFLVDDETLDIVNKTLTDLYTDDFFKPLTYKKLIIKAEFSRLLVDVERFIDDKKEIMSKVGMGITYTKDHNGALLRKIDNDGRQNLIEDYYLPHHKRLEKAVENSLGNYGECLILDLHSFASKPLTCDNNQDELRPDVCLGYDDFHAPLSIIQEIRHHLEDAGLTVACNMPFAGSIVPMKFYKKDSRVRSLMIEVNKRIYMDEDTFLKNQHFKEMSELVCDIIKRVVLES